MTISSPDFTLAQLCHSTSLFFCHISILFCLLLPKPQSVSSSSLDMDIFGPKGQTKLDLNPTEIYKKSYNISNQYSLKLPFTCIYWCTGGGVL